MKKFWVSWVTSEEAPYGSFELNSPWWVSGYAADERVICAAVKAESEIAARRVVEQSHDDPVSISFRFVEERPADWDPFNSRFRRAAWMKWS